MDVTEEIGISSNDQDNVNDLHRVKTGETVRMGEWFVTKVISGWIYTLKTSNAMSGGALAEHHSIFVPKE
jgi:hypothetical protein